MTAAAGDELKNWIALVSSGNPIGICRAFCFVVEWGYPSSKDPVTNMDQRSVVYKGFLICMVLFCAYMQLSPFVDLDYVWINGHEHYVGAPTLHHAGKMVVANVRQAIGRIFEVFVPQFQPLRLAQSATRLAPPTTLRL